MKNLYSPFNLKNKISTVNSNLDFIPLIDMLCIAFLIFLVSSRFIFAPGLTIDLPKAHENLIPGTPTSAVLTIKEGNIFILDGNIYSFDYLSTALNSKISKVSIENPTLLVIASKNVDINVIFKVCEIAKDTGFTQVQLAGNISNS